MFYLSTMNVYIILYLLYYTYFTYFYTYYALDGMARWLNDPTGFAVPSPIFIVTPFFIKSTVPNSNIYYTYYTIH